MKKGVGAIAATLWRKLIGTTVKNIHPLQRNTRLRKAIAYSADIPLGSTGDVISRAWQKELIRQYAAENNVEVVAWYEDEIFEEDLLKRPGIQALLAHQGPVELFLVERVWALSRKIATLREFFASPAIRSLKLETATYLWDCASQMVRRQIAGASPAVAPRFNRVTAQEPGRMAPIAKPERLHFVGWAFASRQEAEHNQQDQAA